MIDFNITEEDKKFLSEYRNTNFLMVNQLLISRADVDISLLNNADENEVVPISYDVESIKENLEKIKKLYEIMLKCYYNKINKSTWELFYGTNVADVGVLKNEIYIGNFLLTNSSEEEMRKKVEKYEMPAIVRVLGDGSIPVINLDEILGNDVEAQECLIAPFTKIKEFKEKDNIKIDDLKTIRNYEIILEKQDLQELTKEEKDSVYNYILTLADVIDQKLWECVEYEKETEESNESIRKLEQLLSKYQFEINKKIQLKDYPEGEREADEKDVERIKENIDDLNDRISNIYEEKKIAIDFITKWKKNVAVYIMAEFKALEVLYENEAKAQNLNYDEKMKALEEEAKEKHEKLKDETVENIAKTVNKECDDNIIVAKRLLGDIKRLISKQQNHAKIAGNIGATYSALINCFEIKDTAEILLEKIEQIKDKAKELCDSEDREGLSEKLLNISNVNMQISTLMNYLNNPKSSVGKSKITRFEEMAIIEENELKRAIAERILNVRGEAELKKLKDDLEMLEEKGAFKRFIGFFTGSNKLDEVKEEQIEIRQKAIRKTLSQKMSLVYNYSIHELVAEIEMFLNDNEDDELVEEDNFILQNMEDELRRNFIISDSKVQDIINQRENRNLPVEVKKITKRELIEIETYRFLNKYGYDKSNDEEDVPYRDTMQSEIARIIDYIGSSGVLD